MRKGAGKTRYRLSAEAKVRLPDVEDALNIGYAIHASDDPDLLNDKGEPSEAQKTARELVEKFRGLKGRTVAEKAYLLSMEGIVLSHGRGITRRKRQYIKDIETAREERSMREAQLRDSRWSSGGLAAFWKVLSPLMLGLAGYLVAQVLGISVSSEVSGKTGDKLPSVLMGMFFIFIGRYVGFMWADYKRSKILLLYDSRCFFAMKVYEDGKLEEYDLYRKRLCHAWKQYTGAEYPKTASYNMVMKGDLRNRESLEESIRRANMNEFARLALICKTLFGSIKFRRKKVQLDQSA